jgi:hypothetical protein
MPLPGRNDDRSVIVEEKINLTASESSVDKNKKTLEVSLVSLPEANTRSPPEGILLDEGAADSSCCPNLIKSNFSNHTSSCDDDDDDDNHEDHGELPSSTIVCHSSGLKQDEDDDNNDGELPIVFHSSDWKKDFVLTDDVIIEFHDEIMPTPNNNNMLLSRTTQEEYLVFETHIITLSAVKVEPEEQRDDSFSGFRHKKTNMMEEEDTSKTLKCAVGDTNKKWNFSFYYYDCVLSWCTGNHDGVFDEKKGRAEMAS